MAVSSTQSTSGSSIDVASIVSGLMDAEKVPVTRLEAKISKSTFKISALGQIKSQMSALKTALTDLQTPTNFYSWDAKFSSSGFASGQITSSQTAGDYQVEVTRLARASITNVTGFATADDASTWYNASAQSTLKSQADATVLMSTSGQYVLSLKAKSTGSAAAFSVTLNSTDLAAGKVATEYQSGLNATFKLNGVSFERASNSVTDALDGITLNLQGVTSSPITLSVSKNNTSPRAKLDALVKSYNDLYALYKEQTVSSIDAATRGVLNSDFGVSSMMRQIGDALLLPMRDSTGGELSGSTDLSALGLKFEQTGELAVDATLLAAATTLNDRLVSGVRIGFDSGKDLSTKISEMLTSGGVIQDSIENEQSAKTVLVSKKTALEEKLVSVQARYYAQYAALDALLFKLKSTSDSLKSALDGLTAGQNNN
jgi:flagellar hook-associated protein 2